MFADTFLLVCLRVGFLLLNSRLKCLAAKSKFNLTLKTIRSSCLKLRQIGEGEEKKRVY